MGELPIMEELHNYKEVLTKLNQLSRILSDTVCYAVEREWLENLYSYITISTSEVEFFITIPSLDNSSLIDFDIISANKETSLQGIMDEDIARKINSVETRKVFKKLKKDASLNKEYSVVNHAWWRIIKENFVDKYNDIEIPIFLESIPHNEHVNPNPNTFISEIELRPGFRVSEREYHKFEFYIYDYINCEMMILFVPLTIYFGDLIRFVVKKSNIDYVNVKFINNTATQFGLQGNCYKTLEELNFESKCLFLTVNVEEQSASDPFPDLESVQNEKNYPELPPLTLVSNAKSELIEMQDLSNKHHNNSLIIPFALGDIGNEEIFYNNQVQYHNIRYGPNNIDNPYNIDISYNNYNKKNESKALNLEVLRANFENSKNKETITLKQKKLVDIKNSLDEMIKEASKKQTK